ncbi:LLM class flavin-dependent oxidoreductase [Microbacterium saperdae]|uniref:Alkanesulfonate monooxygenase SsuD/methylene tetrahydromethanopterin reductase-like flavin-dependent oxidoreductase (Luciferase family) n=1 Tax=Microbacterium saperdae TaxID=69368 RepID=A0A543B9Y2_9MICO|nr:LLM class flavin-dependent oxidoreductase [Microbacterium saperdae]TQL81641.1 alkanesulfonate monooxygenase SsuD/methylene tetrahydromethanopterin reductase-like flavin-dependent oxidoreductase (luciferase family) [Microbacterium saperdae]GGM33610.1 hypothetical protein GCM10010489_00490 [Microbacterium saperdae]
MPRFGLALNLGLEDRSVPATARLYEDVLDVVAYAEQSGIDAVWIGQHHFTNTPGPVPSPLVLLTAAVARTSRIDLGTGIVTLPLEDPIRLAEDAGTLDVLSGGRVQLGVGTGGANLGAFSAFGHDSADRHRLFDEKIARLNDILAGRPVSDSSPAIIQPHVPDLHRRVWQAVTSLDRARSAGRLGQGIQVGAFFDSVVDGQLPKVEAYLDAYSSTGPDDLPRIGVFRFVYLGVSRDAVLAELEPILGPRLPLLADRASVSGNDRLRGLGLEDYLDAVGAIYGSADDAQAALAADPVVALATDVVANSAVQSTFSATASRAQVDALVAVRSEGVLVE